MRRIEDIVAEMMEEEKRSFVADDYSYYPFHVKISKIVDKLKKKAWKEIRFK